MIQGARIIDPGQGSDVVSDLLIEEGKILSAGKRIAPDAVPEGSQVIPASGLVACPGFIDLHCHLREPGFEYKETIATGTRAAARGGFTTVCCMPNTQPAIDNAAVVDFIQRRARSEGVVRVWPIGCVTKERRGKELAEMEELATAGVVAFSDDGDPVYDPNLMRLALAYSQDLGLPISNHCQERSLSREGVMAQGWVATRLGLPGIPAAAEEAMIARDIALAELTGGRLHLAHLSTAGSVSLVRQAKQRGVPVTAEVCPHHLTITDRWALGGQGRTEDTANTLSYDTFTKVYPPLRAQQDVDALVDALAEGVIDCIATDHAPHDLASKQVTYQEAAFGISVLETALGSLLGLVHQNRISLSTLIERLTSGPAQILGPAFSDLATLKPGTPADIVLFDPEREWVVDPREFASKGKNTPLAGTTLKGEVVMTLVEGQVVYQERALAGRVK
jgi:dihydroorotase